MKRILTRRQYERLTAYHIDPLMAANCIVLEEVSATRNNFEVEVERDLHGSSGFKYKVREP